MRTPMKQKISWEKELRKIMLSYGYEDAVEPVKEYIRTVRQQAFEEAQKNWTTEQMVMTAEDNYDRGRQAALAEALAIIEEMPDWVIYDNFYHDDLRNELTKKIQALMGEKDEKSKRMDH